MVFPTAKLPDSWPHYNINRLVRSTDHFDGAGHISAFADSTANHHPTTSLVALQPKDITLQRPAQGDLPKWGHERST
jgi:hypothetical protein